MHDRFSFVIRAYGMLLATALLGYMAFYLIISGEDTPVVILSIIMVAVLVSVMTMSDPIFFFRLLDKLFSFGKQRDDE